MPAMTQGNNMKVIEPILAWYNGVETEGTVLSLQCNSDNLFNQASFNYSIFSTSEPTTGQEYGYLQATLVQGYLTMTGAEYEAWQTNDYAFEWAAGKLNLTLVGPYVPPSPNPTP
jgi:hypothetical protein